MQPSQHVIHLCLLLAVSCFAAPSGVALEKFEPPEGCYLGAYIEQDPVTNGDIAAFEALTGKKHASYFKYVGYGRPFPTEWVEKVKAAGAVPQIAWEYIFAPMGAGRPGSRLPSFSPLRFGDERNMDGLQRESPAVHRQVPACS